MKKLLFVICLVVIFTSIASAQVSKPFSVYAGGGLTLLQGDYGDYYKNGYHGMGAAGFSLAPMFQLMGKLEYHTLPVDAAAITNDVTIIMYGAGFKFAPTLPGAPIKPFGIVGGGMATLKTDASFDLGDFGTVDLGTVSSNEFYYEFGAGLELKASPGLSFFVMARYVTIANEFADFKYIPITVGLKF
ncbi:MAG: outer membrane beta-barrel protein [candidate division Zixibacteria bacterium]|nr:outer membrane beta-barrel protein [candidate division Zixibacteria bacterium]